MTSAIMKHIFLSIESSNSRKVISSRKNTTDCNSTTFPNNMPKYREAMHWVRNVIRAALTYFFFRFSNMGLRARKTQ